MKGIVYIYVEYLHMYLKNIQAILFKKLQMDIKHAGDSSGKS